MKERVNPTSLISGSSASTACHLQSRWHNPAQESTNCGSRALETEWRVKTNFFYRLTEAVRDFPQFLQQNATD
jgi:hypothetical protein